MSDLNHTQFSRFATGLVIAAMVALCLVAASAPSHADDAQVGDVKAGLKVFRKCKACHYADRPKHRTGPHLIDVFGRVAGALEDFKYSKAMKESNITWDDESMTAFLRAPKKYLKGTKMVFVGLRKEEDIVNVIAYLKSLQ